MLMTIRMSAIPKCPNSTVITSKYLISRFQAFACLRKASLTINRRLYPQFCFFEVAPLPFLANTSKRMRSSTARSSVDDGGLGSPPGSTPGGGTRLVQAIQALQVKLNARFVELKKGFPMKVLFFLVGFYCATAFATVIGQTGDWDILSAGLAVVVVEGIGALMYKASLPLLDKIRSLITMLNYWKAGLSLGLFLDAFKYQVDDILGSSNPLNFGIDFFPMILLNLSPFCC